MKLTATSISKLHQKIKYQYCHCTRKIPRKLPLTEFPSSGHILWHENKGAVFAKRRKKEKYPNVTTMHKNIQKIF